MVTQNALRTFEGKQVKNNFKFTTAVDLNHDSIKLNDRFHVIRGHLLPELPSNVRIMHYIFSSHKKVW